MGLVEEMKTLYLYLAYVLVLFNAYLYLVLPDFLIQSAWKWDVFVVLLFAPLVYWAHRDDRG